LRRRIRAKRRALPDDYRRIADRAIAARIRYLPEFQRARRVAVFLAFDGEPSLAKLVEAATLRGKQLYAPVLKGMTMTFRELNTRGALAANFFGILEPGLGERIDARTLDLVLTPLVAFDDRGTRIGVGRGYYDRCFRFLRHRTRWQRPKLLGVAYELQHVPPLAANPWDIPLWGVVTEAGFRRFAQSQPR
jgi:5-formyltetrahydrofolate cyclo-ligase